MSIYYYATKINGDYIFDNFPTEVKQLILHYKANTQLLEIEISNIKYVARIGRKSNNFGIIYILTTDKKYIKGNKLFKELIDISLIGLEPLSKFKDDIAIIQNSQNQEFIHNVISLNTHSIQDLFALVPQSILTANINKQSEAVRQIIGEKPNIAVETILKLIKYNLAMKVEFSVFDRTLKPSVFTQKTDHSIRAIILSVLQIFIDDFEKLKIEVHLDACERRLNVDYDSLFVSLYYIMDNSIKYCCPHTKYKIIFKEEGDFFCVLFIMISIRIEKNEIEKLSINGYRSDAAISLHVKGTGIGMYRILKTLKLNDAELEITPRINDFTRTIGNIIYEGNQFKIKFKGQKDWLK